MQKLSSVLLESIEYLKGAKNKGQEFNTSRIQMYLIF